MPAVLLLVVPLVFGAVAMGASGASPARWASHLAIGGLGVACYLAARAWPGATPRLGLGLMVASPTLIAATLAFHGYAGVHRWVDLGPLRVNPSALLAPLLLVLAAAQVRRRPLPVVVILSATQAVHFLQPDAGQATAVGIAALVVLSSRGAIRWLLAGWGGGVGLALLVAAGGTWLRRDPLPAAPYVEDALQRAVAVSPLLGLATALSLALFVLAPLQMVRRARPGHDVRPALALSAYFAGTLLAAVVGHFPVPLVGLSPSVALGAFLGLATLRRLLG